LTCTNAGGSASATATVVAGKPIAVIDAVPAVVAYSTVLLDGTSSTDTTTSIQAYAWKQTAGPAVSVSNAGAVQASFVAPQVASQTALTFMLTVTDTTGTTSSASTTVNVSPATASQLAVSLVSAYLLAAVPPNPHTDFTLADGPPLSGANSAIQVTMTGALQSPVFTLVDAGGNVLSTLTLNMSGTPSIQPLTYFGPLTVPTVPFRVAVSGTTADGQSFALQSATLFTPMNMSLNFSPAVLFLVAGTAGNSQLTIYNGGPTARFTIQFNDPNGVLTSGQPVSVQIAASSSATVPVSVAYPPAAAGIIGPTVTATASIAGDAGDAGRTGTATLRLWQAVAQ
jgi:hypothetical protein